MAPAETLATVAVNPTARRLGITTLKHLPLPLFAVLNQDCADLVCHRAQLVRLL